VIAGPGAARGHVDLAGIGFGVGNELGHGLDRQRRVDLEHERIERDDRDRHDIANEVELEVLVECRIARVRLAGRQQRIAVGGCVHDRLGGDVGAGARPVLDDELLAQSLRQRLCHQAGHDVSAAARRKSNDDPHRFCRIGLSARAA